MQKKSGKKADERISTEFPCTLVSYPHFRGRVDATPATRICGPLAETGPLLRLDPVADRDDDVEVVQCYRLVGKSKLHFLHIAFFFQRSLLENVPYMTGDNRLFAGKQNCHLILGQPDGLMIEANFKGSRAIRALIQNYCINGCVHVVISRNQAIRD